MDVSRKPKTLYTLGVVACVLFAGVLIGSSDQIGEMALLGAIGLLGIALLFGLLNRVPKSPMRSAPVEQNSAVMNEVRERAHAISEMANTLGATLDYNKVLEAAMNIGALAMKEGGQNARLTSMVLIFEKDQMRIATSRRLTNRDQTKIVPARSGVLGQALELAEPVFAGRCNDDPELGYFVAFQDAQSVLVIPLRAGFSNYGLLVFGSTEANAFLPEHAELLSAIGTQATVALQNAVLYKNLRDEKERIVKVEEDARKKLARDLHDGPTQTISAVAMRINYIRKMLVRDPSTAEPELEKAEDLARQATKEIRNMLFNLRPLVLETQGLGAALEQFRQKMKDTYELNVALELQPGVDQLLESQAQGVLFYIIEEAVNNARKHAQANLILISMQRQNNVLLATVRDDGVGFDVAAVDAGYDKRGSLGMVNMHERAELIDGTLRIESAKGKGTSISILVPLSARGAAQPSTQTVPSQGGAQ
jgi:signal transduction histidine kinase